MPLGPEFSAVIPAFNASAWVADAVESALGQRGVEVEVIVVDDGSTDATAQVLARFGSRIQVERQENRGVAIARNRGAEVARGRYLAFLDADDVWAPEKLARQAAALAATVGAKASSTAFRVVDTSGRELERRGGEATGEVFERLLFEGNVVGTPSTVACDRGLFLDAGGFDPSLSQCADWELWLRLALRTRFASVAEALVTYRQHAGNMSRDVPLLERDSLMTLDKAFALPGLPAPLRARRAEAYGFTYLVLAGSYFQVGRYGDFLRCATRSLMARPRGIGRFASYPLRRWRRS